MAAVVAFETDLELLKPNTLRFFGVPSRFLNL